VIEEPRSPWVRLYAHCRVDLFDLQKSETYISKQLVDKIYEKRKAAALELERSAPSPSKGLPTLIWLSIDRSGIATMPEISGGLRK
jgi:hypothetical protein